MTSPPPSPPPPSPPPLAPFRTHFISHEEVNKPSGHQVQQIVSFSLRKTAGTEFDIASLLCRKRDPTEDDDEKYSTIHSMWERAFPTPSVLKYNQKWKKIISESTSSPSSSPLSLFGLCDVEVSISPTERILAAVSPYNCQFINIDDFDSNGVKKQPCCYHFPPSTGPVAVKGSIGVSWSGDGCLFSVFFRLSGLVFIFYFPPKKQNRRSNINDRPFRNKKINKGGLIGVVSLPESNVFVSSIIDAKLGNEIEYDSDTRVNLFVLGENRALYCVSACLSNGNQISWTPFEKQEDITQIKGEITHREDLSLSLSFSTSLSLHFCPSSSSSSPSSSSSSFSSSSFLFGENKKEKTTLLSICGTGVKGEGAILLFSHSPSSSSSPSSSPFSLVGSGEIALVGEGEKGGEGAGKGGKGGIEMIKAWIGGKRELGKRICKTSFSPNFETICCLTSLASLVFLKKNGGLKVTKQFSARELQQKYSEYFPTEKGDNASDGSAFIWSMRWVSPTLLLLVWTTGNVNVVTAETMTDASDSFDVFGYKHEPFPSLDSHLSLFCDKTSVVISETVVDFLPVGNQKKIPIKEEHTTLFRYLPPSLLYENHIQSKNFEAAIAIAEEHGLDTDEATQKKWLATDLTRKSMKFYFKNMKDFIRAVAGCLTFSPRTAKEQLLLFVTGMQQCRPSYIKKLKQKGKEKEIEGENENNLSESKSMDDIYGYLYLIFLDCYNRFLTYVHLCGGKGEEDVSVIPYSSEQFLKFRTKNLSQYFVDSISSKKFDQTSSVLFYHFDQVEHLYFPLLSSICETTPPKSYSFLLPGPQGRITTSPSPSRYQLDGQEIKQTLNLPKNVSMADLIEKLSDFHQKNPSISWLHSFFSSFSPSVSPPSLPLGTEGEGWKEGGKEAGKVGEWYLKRASEIEEISGLVNYAVDLLEIGVKKGLPSLSPSLSVYRVLSSLVYSSSLSDISLSDVEKLDPFQILKLLGSSVNCFDGADDEEDTACLLVQRLYTRFLPLMKAWTASSKTTETTEELIVKYIETKLSHQSLLACRAIIIQSIQQIDAGTPEKALLSSISSIMRVTVKCVFSTTSPDSWSQMLTFCKETEEWRKKHLKSDDPHLLDLADVMEVGSSLSLFSHQLCSPQQISEAKNDPVATEDFILRLCREALKSPSVVVWDEILKDILLIRNKLCPSLSVDFCFELLCECCLRSGCFTLPPILDTKQVSNIIFQVAQDFFRSGDTPNDDTISSALSCIRTGPECAIFSSEESFYEAYISIHSEFSPEGKVLLNPTQFRTLDTKEIFQMFLTSPKMKFKNQDRLIEIGKIIYENRAVHAALDRQGEEGKVFLTSATKENYLPPNFEEYEHELLLEVAFEALRRRKFTKAASICDSLAQKQYQPCYRISEQLMTQETLPTAVRQKMSTYSLAFCPSKDLRDISFKQTVFAQQQLHKQQHQHQQHYSQPQQPQQPQPQQLGVHPFYLNLLGEVSSLHSGTELPQKKILVALDDQDENAKFVSIDPLEDLSRGLYEFSENFSYWRAVQDASLEASFYGMSDGRQWVGGEEEEGKGEKEEKEEEGEMECKGKDHPLVLAAQHSLPTDTPLSLSFLLSTLLTSPPPNTPLPSSHPPSLPTSPSPCPLPPFSYERASEEMEKTVEAGVEGGRESEIYFILTSYLYSLAILMLAQGKNANISLFSKTFSQIIALGEEFLSENQIESLPSQSRFYCDKLMHLSKKTETMSKEKEIRSFLPNVDVVKFMESDEYKKEYIQGIAKKEEIEIMIPIAEHFGFSMRSLIKIRIQELFQEGLSFEMEGDLNDAKYNSQAIKDIFRFHKDHLSGKETISWLETEIFPLMVGSCHVILTCYFECLLEAYLTLDPEAKQEIHRCQQHLLALEIVKKLPQDFEKKVNIFSLFTDGITEEFCVIFRSPDVLPSLRLLSSSLPPISFLPPLWRALQIGIKEEGKGETECQEEEIQGLYALSQFEREKSWEGKKKEESQIGQLVKRWVEEAEVGIGMAKIMERVREVIGWEAGVAREEEGAVFRTKIFLLLLLWEKTNSPFPLSASLFPPSSSPSLARWDIQRMFCHLLQNSSTSVHIIILAGIIMIWERMKDVEEKRQPGDALEEMGKDKVIGEVIEGKGEEEEEDDCSLWEGMWLFLYEKLLVLEDFATLSRVLTDKTFSPLEGEGFWVSETYQRRLILTLLKQNGKGKEFLFCVLFGLLSHSSSLQNLSFSLLSESEREIFPLKEEEEKEESGQQERELSQFHNSLSLAKVCENSSSFHSISFVSEIGQGVLLFDDWLLVLDALFVTGLFTTLTPKKYPFLAKEIDDHLWRCSIAASPFPSTPLPSVPSPSLNSFFIDSRGRMERSLCSVVAILCTCGRTKEAVSLVIKAYKKISLHPALLRASYSGALLKKFLKTHLKMDESVISVESSISLYKVKKQLSSALQILS